MDKEKDIMRELCIKQGYVPRDCKMPGVMIQALTGSQGDACKGCNADRSTCKGRSKD